MKKKILLGSLVGGLILSTVAVIVAALLLVSPRINSSSEPELTPENVARFWAAGMSGLDTGVLKMDNVSHLLNASEAYAVTITNRKTGTVIATVVVARTTDGWRVVL